MQPNAGKSLLCVEAQMLGGFNLFVNGIPLNDRPERSKQLKSLLAYLLVKRFDHVSQERLIDILWPEEDSENPANALKNLVYRLRRTLSSYEPLKEYECILCRGGTYAWNNSITCTIDAEELDRLYKEASDESIPNPVRIEKYLTALSLYKGGFLSDLSYEEWVVPLSSYYQNVYMSCLYNAVNLLMLEDRYAEIVGICEQAVTYEPYEEAIHEILLRALLKLGKKNKALDHYEYISQKFYRDLGVKLSEPLRELHKELLKTTNDVATDIAVIKEGLCEVDPRGAFFCDYEIFKNLYCLEARTAERSGQAVFICLITICEYQNLKPSKQAMMDAMEKMKEAIMGSLRKGDVFSRFSATQYTLMLPTTSYENGEMVLNRIIKQFRRICKNPAIRVKVTLEPVVSAV